jgi:hypothetical protein
MEHEVVVRQQMTESYLLGELQDKDREEFEAHFFDCPECARDVRAAALFVEQSKMLLAEQPSASTHPAPLREAKSRSNSGWLSWLRPAFAVPALALLLAVIGVQQYRLQHKQVGPQLLPLASINIGTWGASEAHDQIELAAPNQSFLLLVKIPPDNCPEHTAELYNPAGKPEWSLTFPTNPGQDQALQVPGALRAAGTYKLVVNGVTSQGVSTPVGQALFDVKIRD